MAHRSCLMPRHPEESWLRTNIFRSTCAIQGLVCSFIIDSESCRSVISETAIKKLGILKEPHPAPYALGWLSEGVNLRITQRALVSFSIGPHYKDCIYYDVAPMDISHLILGRPWEFDRKVTHDGAKNTYSFTWDSHQIVLLPSRENTSPEQQPSPSTVPATTPIYSTTMLCSYSTFISEIWSEGHVFSLIPTTSPTTLSTSTNPTLTSVLKEFDDIFWLTSRRVYHRCVIYNTR